MPFVTGDELFNRSPPQGYALKAPATEAQQKLLTEAGYAKMSEADIKAARMGNLPDKENIWWQTRMDPDPIPREALFPKQYPDGNGRACPDNPGESGKREELDMER